MIVVSQFGDYSHLQPSGQLQQFLVSKFTSKNDSFEMGFYNCDEIPKNSIGNKGDKLFSVWQDFVSIHMNLIQRQLKQSLLQFGKVKNEYDYQGVQYLYGKFKIGRNMCASLPIKHNNRQFDNAPEYCDMIEHFEKKGNDTLKKFLIIYNGIGNIFLRYHEQFGYGFDAFLLKNNVKNVSIKDTS